MPKISVIMAAYNAERTIKEAVDSILSQTYKDFELLINDGGSTDKTIDIIKSYEDDRIVLMHQKKAGLPAARNEPLAIVKGEYIAIMDTDDISLPQRFEKQVKYFEENEDCGIVGTGYQTFGEGIAGEEIFAGHHDVLSDKDDLFFRGRPFVAHPTGMIRKSLLDIIKEKDGAVYREQFFVGEDCDMWIRLAQHSRIHNIEEILLKYRISSTSAHHNDEAKSYMYAFFASVNYYERMTGAQETYLSGVEEGLKILKKKYKFYHPIWIYFMYEKYFDLNGYYKIFGKWKQKIIARRRRYLEKKYNKRK